MITARYGSYDSFDSLEIGRYCTPKSSNGNKNLGFWGVATCASVKFKKQLDEFCPLVRRWGEWQHFPAIWRTRQTNVGRKKSSNTVSVNTMATVWMLPPDTCQPNQGGGLIAILAVPRGKQKRVILRWRWVPKKSRGSIIRLEKKAKFHTHRGWFGRSATTIVLHKMARHQQSLYTAVKQAACSLQQGCIWWDSIEFTLSIV